MNKSSLSDEASSSLGQVASDVSTHIVIGDYIPRTFRNSRVSKRKDVALLDNTPSARKMDPSIVYTRSCPQFCAGVEPLLDRGYGSGIMQRISSKNNS